MKNIRTILLIIIFCSRLIINNCFAGELQNIRLNEIHPNPDGKDQGNEWLEIINNKKEDISLSGWTLTTSTKSQKLPDKTVKAGNIALIGGKELKISLKNNEETLTLLDQNNNIVDQISYEKAPKGKSISRVSVIKDKKSYLFLDWADATKNQKNQSYLSLNGKIISEPVIQDEYFFEIAEKNYNNKYTVYFNENYDFEQLKNSFKKGAELLILAEKQNKGLLLKEFKILKSAPIAAETEINETKNTLPQIKERYYYMIPLFLLVILLLSFFNRFSPGKASH